MAITALILKINSLQLNFDIMRRRLPSIYPDYKDLVRDNRELAARKRA